MSLTPTLIINHGLTVRYYPTGRAGAAAGSTLSLWHCCRRYPWGWISRWRCQWSWCCCRRYSQMCCARLGGVGGACAAVWGIDWDGTGGGIACRTWKQKINMLEFVLIDVCLSPDSPLAHCSVWMTRVNLIVPVWAQQAPPYQAGVSAPPTPNTARKKLHHP